jgi:hypothetical protein
MGNIFNLMLGIAAAPRPKAKQKFKMFQIVWINEPN